MNITNNFTIHLDDWRILPKLHGVQGDANTRSVKLTLMEGGEAWKIPDDVVASVGYRHENGGSGWYDTLPDGTAACTISGNTVTAVLAPGVFAAQGRVSLTVILQESDTLDQIATFPLELKVAANPTAEKLENSYYNYSTMESVNAALERLVGVTGEVYTASGGYFLQNCSFTELLAAYKGGACVRLFWHNPFANFSSLYTLSYVPMDESYLIFRGERGCAAAEFTVYADDSIAFSAATSVPVERTVNGKSLGQDIVLTAEDVGALPDSTQIPEVPEALPNPNKLIISGAVSAEYDGSAAVSVSIPHSSVDPEAVDSAVTEYLRVNPVKTAYEYAVDGGYPGTEAEFARELSTMGTGQAVQEAELTEVWAAIAALRNGVETTYPLIDVPSGWYIAGELGANMAKSAITKITICDSYDTTDKTIDKSYYIASLGEDIMFHRVGTEMIIAGNGSGKIKLGENAQAMFNSFTSLEEIVGLELLDVSDVTALNAFFLLCPSLKTVDISAWNCVRVTNIQRMFYNCSALESVKMPRYGLPAVSNSKEVFEGCYALKSVDIGRSLPVVGEKAFYKCHSLENVTGLNRVTSIGDYAFIYTPSVETDLEPERITHIGEQALRLSGVEDTADMSGVADVGADSTRLARWTQQELDEIRAVKLPTVYFPVPNSENQDNYADATEYPFSTVDEDGDGIYETALSVSESGCSSLALYHIWQATYAGTDKEYASYAAWFEAVNGSFAEFSANNHMASNPAAPILENMGWERIDYGSIFVKERAHKEAIATELSNGRPVFVCMHSANTLDDPSILHAIAIIGSDEASDKLCIIDSHVYGSTGVESWVAFEDLFSDTDYNGTTEDGQKINADWMWAIKPKE